MKKKNSFSWLIQFWGAVFLVALGIIIIIVDVFVTQQQFASRAAEMRSSFVSHQEQLVQSEVNRVVNLVNHEKSRSERLTKTKIKARAYEAHAIAANIYNLNKDTKSKTEIEKMIMEALRAIRFEGGIGYYFIVHVSGNTVLSPAMPALEGTNILNLRDSKGNEVVKEEMELLQNKGEGFVTGYWPRPGSDQKKDFKKLTFVKLFKPYNWSIGAGLYVDDIEIQLKNDSLERIAKIRFGHNSDGYIFVVSYAGSTLMNDTQRQLIGKNIWDLEDPNGVKVVQEERKAVENSAGDFIRYSWNKPSTKKVTPKVSFVRGVSGWEWMIGAGVYLDDVDAEIAIMQRELKRTLMTKFFYSSAILVGMIVLLLWLSNIIVKRMRSDFNSFSSFLNEAAFSDKQINIEKIKFDEFRQLAQSANMMLQQRTKLERELLSEKEQLFVTIKSIGDGVITTDRSGNVVLLNNVAEQLTGWNQDEAVGRPLAEIFNIVNATTRKDVENPVVAVFKTGVIVGLANHTLLIARDGTEHQVADSAAPIKDPDGEISGVVLVFRDVTEEYRVQKALTYSEERFRSFFEQGMMGMTITSVTTNWLAVNDIICEMLGYSREELLDMTWVELTHPDDLEADTAMFNKLLAGEFNAYSLEKRFIRKNGDFVPTVISINAIRDCENGSVDSVFGLVRDISKYKKLEEESLQLQEQLGHKNKMDAIGQLAGGIAHDFNNMLGGIMGAAQLLKLPKRKLDDKSLSYVDLILKSSTQAADLTAKLLAFGRKGKMLSSNIDIHPIIEDTVAILVKTIDKKIVIVNNYNAVDSIITGDIASILNSLINLGINASHAMVAGGKLTFTTDNIELNQDYCAASVFDISPGKYIKLSVKDTGTGISKENIDKIFEPFFTTRDQGKGSGLGLSSVYGTVQDHRGAINVYSELGVGTEFHIYLPLSQDKSITPVLEPDTGVVPGSGKIILIDDEETIRVTGTHMMEEMGYEVLAFASGLEAVKMYEQCPQDIDLVITDMIMPEINGREVFDKLRAINKNCKVILSSGFTRDEDVAALKEDGLSGFIGKPFSDVELSHALGEVLKS